ncbi:hypothetical protein UFOVP329_71 [uncultured Caudovirales phage]|uniref:Uncharacterized protein n=1 Tax=uncultured Caudovirales phage TaxID=2100421 RepID=A0A6J5M302_9CAUD|nr:hypothetical protein UFOVP329_71 [uncultured Caudovirales phage]
MTTPMSFGKRPLLESNVVSQRPILSEYFDLARDIFGFAVVTMTTPEYAGVDDRLASSCRRVKRGEATLPIARFRCQSLGGWARNCALKPLVMLKAAQMFGMPILWLDADSEIPNTKAAHEAIARLADGKSGLGGATIAAFCPALSPSYKKRFPLINSNLCSGTLWVGEGRTGESILVAWATRCAADPEQLDQESLWDVAKGIVSPMCPELCCIPDLMPSVVEPIVVHHQASRTMREVVDSGGSISPRN